MRECEGVRECEGSVREGGREGESTLKLPLLLIP